MAGLKGVWEVSKCKPCNGDAKLPDDEGFRFYAEHVEYIGENSQ